jgi:uncharacterized repeat protein (TIGR03803 family)
LITDSAGNRYGTTGAGGSYDGGAVFELSPNGSGGWTEKLLYSFKTFGGDGTSPSYGNLILDSHGNLYGTTTGGGGSANCGPYGCGTVFELSPGQGGSWTEAVLHNFGTGTDGYQPDAGLIFDSAGNLYGTTGSGGANGAGTVFEMSPRQGGGWTETVLYSFNPNGTDAYGPEAGLIFDAHGNLYGVTNQGGVNYEGAVFELSPRHGGGWTETVLYSFCNLSSCTDGSYPNAGGLIFDSSGNLYGTTGSGGAYGGGTVFELSLHSGSWTETVLHSFGQGTDGNDPGYGTLIMGPGSVIYGMTISGGLHGVGSVFELSPRRGGGWTEAIIHTFNDNGTDGWQPFAGLILDVDGNLYATTGAGGPVSDGTVIELSPRGGGRWKEAVLYSFNANVTDGQNPWLAGLVLDASGNLYGTTFNGGTYDNGTVFELKPNGNGSWTEESIYNFGNSTGTDASDPAAGLIFDGHGNLYGTTVLGGGVGLGTVFELSPRQGGGWSEKVLYSFCSQTGCADGHYSFGGLVFDAFGNLYGTTPYGGTYGYGTVFELSPNGSGGWTHTVLHSFNLDGTDGVYPWAGLTIDSAGNLYGTTEYGGSNYYGGAVFVLAPNGSGGWTEAIAWSFGNGNDGYQPVGSLIFDAAHNLYGTTLYGGANGGGTVYRLSPHNGGWAEGVVYNFCSQTNCTDGYSPYGSLTFFGSGVDLFGTTSGGGANGNGTVFELTPTQGGSYIETVLHSFNPSGGDGSFPEAGVIFDPSGNLYGVTYYGGGQYNAGTVFELESVSRRLDGASAVRR